MMSKNHGDNLIVQFPRERGEGIKRGEHGDRWQPDLRISCPLAVRNDNDDGRKRILASRAGKRKRLDLCQIVARIHFGYLESRRPRRPIDKPNLVSLHARDPSGCTIYRTRPRDDIQPPPPPPAHPSLRSNFILPSGHVDSTRHLRY